MGLISLEGMEFYAYHGCFAEEQVIGNKFIVDLEIETVLEEAAKTDDLSKVVNYQTLYELVEKEMSIKSHLLEHVAGRIMNVIYKTFPSVSNVKLKVSKLNPPLGGKVKQASVTLCR